MKNDYSKRYKLCFVLVSLPIFFTVMFVISFLAVRLLGNSTGSLYTFFVYNMLIIPYACPVPCVASAVIGMFLSKSMSRVGIDTSKIKKLGIIGIVCSFVLMMFVGLLVLVGMQS